MSLVTLLTDFGDQDGFVGAMRGVMLRADPALKLVDLAHHLPRGDLAKASRVLLRAAPCFPEGTVHLVVVDPGVGSARRALVAEAAGHRFVAPDNGVLTAVLEALGGGTCRAIDRPDLYAPQLSSTFHGRDLFAPVAAALATGRVQAAELGQIVEARALSGPERQAIIEVDRFGNLITNVPNQQGVLMSVCGMRLKGPSEAYASVPSGALVLVAGSEGTLEVAVRDGSAAQRLGARVGDEVVCTPADARASSTS